MTHLIVADRLPIFRVGVRSCLRRERDVRVSEATTADDLFALAAVDAPDVVLVDLDLGGVETVTRLAAETEARVAVWSLTPVEDVIVAAIRAGANGYVEKSVSAQGLVRSIRALERGEAVLPRPLLHAVVDALRRVDRRDRVQRQASLLTDREREVLELVARGARNRNIAEALEISEFTVKRHVQNILQKLDVASRAAAASFYRAAVADAALP